jgi:hypothetical protein
MLSRNRICTLLAPLLLCSCAGVEMREDTATPPTYAPQAKYTTQVAVGECAFTRQEESATAAIASALSGNAITAGVNRIGTVLAEAAKEKTLITMASRNIEVSARTFGPCVQVVRGWFYPDPFPVAAGDDPFAGSSKFAAAKAWFSDDFISMERFRKLWLRNQLWLAAAPEFIFEGRIVAASNDALTIAPQYVRMNEPAFTRTLRRDGSRHVAVFLAFHEPDTKVDLENNPAAALVLGKLKPGEVRTYPDPSTIGRFTAKTGFVNRWPHESGWFTLAVGESTEPWIVSAAVAEKQSANEFLAFVGEVFRTSQETIATQLQNVIVPEKRAAARETATSARETAASAFDRMQAAALTVLAQCSTSEAPTPQQASEARAALRDWNKSAREARRNVPASPSCIDMIRITAPASATRSACEMVLTQVTAGGSCESETVPDKT